MVRWSSACAVLLLCLGGAAAQSIPILSLTFEGNAAIDSAHLRSQLRLSRDGGWYRPDVLKVELDSVERYYQEQGYLRAKVGSPQVAFQELPGKGQVAVIRVPVSEGPLYSIGELKVRNVNAFNPSTLVQMSPVHSGQSFNRRKLREWREKVAEGYQTMGYLRFESELIENINEATHVVDCVLDCREGYPYQVGRITVLGVPESDQVSFKKHLLLGEGGLYNPEMILLSLHFINQMGIYRPISLPDVEVTIDDAGRKVDLTFRLVPQRKSSRFQHHTAAPSRLALNFNGGLSKAQQTQPTFKTEVALVNVVFSAMDKNNRSISGLKADDFMVFEDKQPQRIEYFSDLSKGSAVPLTIALLIDTSGSVKNKLGFEKETAADFFRTVLRKGKDLALIIQFDSDVNLVQDFTDDPERLIRSMDGIEAGNSTCLYDAIYLAVDEKLKSEVGRKVIVVITDGEDTSSKLRKETAIEAAQKSDVLIYGVGVRGDFGVNFGVLKKFAEETGGRFFSPRARLDEIQEAFHAIGEDLQGQYSLAYSSTNQKRDGSFRAIEIRSKVSGIRIRARKGYYAPKAGATASN